MRPFSDIFFHCGFEYRLGSALFATVEQQQTRAKRISHLSWEKVKLYIKPFSGARILQCSIILPQKYLKNASGASIFQCPKSPKSACVHLKDKQSSKRAGQKSRARIWKAHAQTTKDKQSSLRSRIDTFGLKTLCLSYELQLSRFIVLMPLLRDLLAL